jgi:radical SAM superfamily enzyme YgiQ (UPF0313 family)
MFTEKGRRNFLVALIRPPLIADSHQVHTIYPPIGLPYLTAVLQKDGHDVKLIDCEGLRMNLEQLREKLLVLQPQVVGITSTTTTIRAALLSAKAAKEVCPNCKVVLGGPHVTFMDKEVFDEEPAADIIVRGEGERTLSELVAALDKSLDADLSKILGL